MQLVGKKDPALSTICNPVDKGEDVTTIVAGMFDLMRKHGGVGLAAPQVGIVKRIIIIEYGAVTTAIINPVITKSPGKIVTSIQEGCLSFPGKRVNLKRHKRVIVEGFNEYWEPVRIDARNFTAFILQHELDHLDGITIQDKS